jgi:hypothetical protein
MKKEMDNTINNSTLERIKKFLEKEIRDDTIILSKKISKGLITKDEANLRRKEWMLLLNLVNRITKNETLLRPQMNLFDVNEYENHKSIF